VEALTVFIKMEYYFKPFTIKVEENEDGRIRVKVDVPYIFVFYLFS